MNYKYQKTQENGDATANYNLVGVFPVKFLDFFKWILNNENSFRIEFCATNECYGGWLGNKLEIKKDLNSGECYWTKQKPNNWFDEISNKKITKCFANGGWGQMTYFCTFEE